MKFQTEITARAVEGESNPPPVFVIMGASVWQGGHPSNAMRRRVQGALTGAMDFPNSYFLATGGVGDEPPAEAFVMSELLREAGIQPENILLEEESRDTLSSVKNCIRILRSLPAFGEVIICSDVYHIPRCRWLFSLLGITSRAGQVASGRAQNPISRWCYYYLREVVAIPWDTLKVLFSRLAGA